MFYQLENQISKWVIYYIIICYVIINYVIIYYASHLGIHLKRLCFQASTKGPWFHQLVRHFFPCRSATILYWYDCHDISERYSESGNKCHYWNTYITPVSATQVSAMSFIKISYLASLQCVILVSNYLPDIPLLHDISNKMLFMK